jgi:hypothetical protein
MSYVQRASGALYFPVMVTRLLAVFALVSAAAALGVLGGRASVPHGLGGGGTWLDGYHAGATAQRNATSDEVRRAVARYQPGEPGFEAIYAAGRREGRRLGIRLGRAEGANTGRRAGFKAGQDATLPQFAGDWRSSHWYLVKLEPGETRSSVRVGKRVLVARGRLYGPCRANPDDICAVPQN